MSKKETNKNIIERFGDSGGYSYYSILHILCMIYAFYLMFKCNRELNIGAFLFACCCPFIYILYHLIDIHSCEAPRF